MRQLVSDNSIRFDHSSVLVTNSVRTGVPIIIWLFVIEAIIAYSRVPFLRIPFSMHMMLTGAFFALFSAYWFGMTHVNKIKPHISNIGGIQLVFILLMLWGMASLVVQDDLLTNLLYWMMWCGGIVAAWWALPLLLRNLSLKDIIRFLDILLVLFIVFSYLSHRSYGAENERLGGLFGSVTVAARFFALAGIYWLTRILYSRGTSLWLYVAFSASVVMLVMTRTRASIGAFCLGVLLVSLFSLIGPLQSQSSRFTRFRALALSVSVVLLFIFAMYADVFSNTSVREHLRISGGVEGVYEARSMNWERALKELPEYGVLGWGFMSKYGAQTYTHNIAGISIPAYDWTTASDPLNIALLTSQQIGIPGGLLVIALYFALFVAAWRSGSVYALGIVGAGIIFGLLDGNWLLSFGDPVDRFSMVALAAFLTRPPSAKI